MLAEKRFLKWKDAKQLIDDAAHDFYATFTPSPDLGCYQVNDGDAQAFELSGNAEVEIGRIGEDGELGFAMRCLRNEAPKAQPDTGQVGDHFDDPDDRKIFRADDGLDTGFAKVRPRTSEKAAIGPPPAKFPHQFGGIIVAGCFSGRYQDGAGGRGQTPE